jgi:hypothetical protein
MSSKALSAEEVERARRMIGACDAAMAGGLGTVTFEGTMFDVPVVERAEALIARAERAPRGCARPERRPGHSSPVAEFRRCCGLTVDLV